MTTIKSENIDRVKKGLEPVFKKKREIKQMKYQNQYEQLEKTGKLDSFMKRKGEELEKRGKIY